jgi:hypothetical protein
MMGKKLFTLLYFLLVIEVIIKLKKKISNLFKNSYTGKRMCFLKHLLFLYMDNLDLILNSLLTKNLQLI